MPKIVNVELKGVRGKIENCGKVGRRTIIRTRYLQLLFAQKSNVFADDIAIVSEKTTNL